MTSSIRTRFLLGLALISVVSCATNPATGRSQLSLISNAQEIEMGRQAAAEVKQTLGFVEDQDLQSYVARVGRSLAASSERPQLPWEFHVVNDPTPNAFALPGGFIYVTRGLMNLMTSEAQLASVLGHEIGHVTARHSVNQISKQQIAQLGLGLGGVFFPQAQQFEPLIGSGLGLLFLKYGRDDERQADQLGFAYMQHEGYQVAEMAKVFTALERSSQPEDSALPSWLSTHPANDERIQTAEQRAVAAGSQADARVDRDVYLQHIDNLVYGEDPRDGFFQKGVFYHPSLRFQFQVPSRWKTRNLPTAVVAAAPDGGAVLQLTLSAGRNPGEALAAFFAQSGVQSGGRQATVIHGQPAELGEFQAQTEQGTVAGLVGYVQYGGRMYQFVGYSAASRYRSYGGELEGAIRSFAPVTDPAILSVQPRRMDIVKLPRALTVAEVARQYASAVPANQLAVINQVPDEQVRLNAGTLVKRVVG